MRRRFGFNAAMQDRLSRFWRDWRGLFLFLAVMLVFRSVVADWNQVPSGSMKPGILDGDRIVVDKLAWDLRVPFTDTRLARWSDPARGDVVTFEDPANCDDLLGCRLFVKRVVAVPGDQVEMRLKRLIVNGERASYEPLGNAQIGALPIEGAARYRFYVERVQGASRLVMLHTELGRRNPRELRAFRAAPAPGDCAQHEAVARAAGEVLANAVCRCAKTGSCSSLPPFTVPPGKYWMMGDYRDNSSDSRVMGFIDRRHIYGRAHAIAFSMDRRNYYKPRFDRFFTDLAQVPGEGP